MAEALLWLEEPRQIREARPGDWTLYGVQFRSYSAPPFPATGGYRAWAQKIPTPEWSFAAEYTIGYYPTAEEANAACQLDYDTYGDTWPAGTPIPP